jgi:hypothetical protein
MILALNLRLRLVCNGQVSKFCRSGRS